MPYRRKRFYGRRRKYRGFRVRRFRKPTTYSRNRRSLYSKAYGLAAKAGTSSFGQRVKNEVWKAARLIAAEQGYKTVRNPIQGFPVHIEL